LEIAAVLSKHSNADATFHPSLQAPIADIELAFRNWSDGTIAKLPLDMLHRESHRLTDTRFHILQTLYGTVERGSVVTYGELSVRSGLGLRAGRAIGNAMAGNPWALFFPCHRVVRCDLSIGNYGMGGAQAKEKLLAMEGVTIRKGICKRI
jgi:methylated-DNA-[protein]-cysteine S-methyltransferase